MNFQRNGLLLIVTILFSFSGSAQILNDSTENVYGPKTTRYFLEEDVFNSIDTLYYMDTVLNAFHRFTYPQRFNYKYQDLGNRGSAIQPLFYKAPANIGFRSGFNAYDLYYNDLLDMRFYDTKSPYTKFLYIQGGRGTIFLETELSRNMTPNWNLGFSFNRISANPQIEYEPRPNNPETDHYSYSAYTAFKTDDEKYYVDAYFRRMHHQVRESGGVDLTSNFLKSDSTINFDEFFRDYTSMSRELSGATSGDLRVNLHLYHEFRFSPLVGVYHLFDYESQRIRYEDVSAPYNTSYYGTNLIDNASTPKETTFFKIYRNDLGLKGEINQFKYRFYYRRRNFMVDNFRLYDVDWQNEDIAGGEFAMRFNERSLFHISSEILGNVSYDNEKKRDYKADLSFENKYIKLKYNLGLYNPSYLQQTYFSNNHFWDKADESQQIESHDLSLITTAVLGPFTITPNVKASRVKNYTYFKFSNNQVQPFQHDKQILLVSPGLDVRIKLGPIILKNSFTYNWQNEKEEKKQVLRLPLMANNLLLYYERTITKKQHVLQAGFDAVWQPGYHADAYMPSIQQFYIQDSENATHYSRGRINTYFVVDFFAAMKINRTRVFAKYSNLTRIAGDAGYLIRPYYYGYKSVLDVGVNWMFFD